MLRNFGATRSSDLGAGARDIRARVGCGRRCLSASACGLWWKRN